MTARQFVARVLVGAVLVWFVPLVLHLFARHAERVGEHRAAEALSRWEDDAARTARTALTITEYAIVAVLVALAVLQ